MKNIIRVFVLSLALISTSGYGYLLVGFSGVSCVKWTKERNAQSVRSAQLEAWITGFLSGFNYSGVERVDILKGNDADGLLAWVDKHCSKNPLKNLGNTAEVLTVKLVLTQY